jgi:hypothetical protein
MVEGWFGYKDAFSYQFIYHKTTKKIKMFNVLGAFLLKKVFSDSNVLSFRSRVSNV